MENMEKTAYEKLINDVFPGLTMYVRDVNLSPVCASKYEPGMIILERGFTDASCRVMGMVTTHRFAILSNHMIDFGLFEHGTNWGLWVARNSSHFKVLDVYSHRGKTQILLLHLPNDERWKVFQNAEFSIEEQLKEKSRQRFVIKSESDPVPELSKKEWLDRCAAPLGMDEGGNLFALDSSSPIANSGTRKQATDQEQEAGLSESQTKALAEVKKYFGYHRGLSNDFIFPKDLLNKLDDENRKKTEIEIIERCNAGDSRFMDALENVKIVDPRKLIKPSGFTRCDDDYRKRCRMLTAIYINTQDLQLLLYLLKMATSNNGAYYDLKRAFQNTDWNSKDPKSESYQLVVRMLKTITCMKRISIRGPYSEIYDEICKSGIKQEVSTPFLSLNDINLFLRNDSWSACVNRDPTVFFQSLQNREFYLKTKNPVYIKNIIRNVLKYPEAYDVLNYMRFAKEIDDSILEQSAMRQELNLPPERKTETTTGKSFISTWGKK